MEETKSKNSNVLKMIIAILLIIVICLCGYIYLNKGSKEYIAQGDNTNVKNENIQESLEPKLNSVIVFDGSKSINGNGKKYTLSCQGNAGIWVNVDSQQKSLTFNFTPTKVVEFYQLTWTSSKNDVTSSKIDFNKKVVDIFFGGMGQSSSGDTLFILLEDGTIEYIPIVHMFNNTQAEVVSYGKIKDISGVAKFTLASTSEGVTTLAIKNDGTFYDLWYVLKDTGNY